MVIGIDARELALSSAGRAAAGRGLPARTVAGGRGADEAPDNPGGAAPSGASSARCANCHTRVRIGTLRSAMKRPTSGRPQSTTVELVHGGVERGYGTDRR